MSYRRFPERIAAGRAWDRFVSANAATIEATGLPAGCLAAIDSFDDFLKHGWLAGPQADAVQVERRNEDQYAALVLLVESYFAAGYEWFPPLALRAEDQLRLASRFGDPDAE